MNLKYYLTSLVLSLSSHSFPSIPVLYGRCVQRLKSLFDSKVMFTCEQLSA